MNTFLVPKQHCILCTEDLELQENVIAYLKDLYNFWPVSDAATALAQIERRTHCLVLVDLRFENALPLLLYGARKKGCVTIALGEPASAPYIDATNIGLYAISDINAAYGELQELLEQAAKHLSSIEESESIATRLADQATRQMMVAVPGTALAGSMAVNKIEVISEVLKKLSTPSGILNITLEEISRQFLPTCVGFLILEGTHYHLRAGLRCPQELWSYRIATEDPFVRWLKIHGQLLSRKALASIEDSANRLMLGQALDTFGADILVPLTQGSTLFGWIFMGKQINGQSYSSDQFPNFLLLADLVSGIVKFLADAEEEAVQQKFARGIIASLPYGMLLIDQNARIVWSNELALHLLALEKDHFSREVDFIDTILADVFHRASGSGGRIVSADRQGKKNGVHISITGCAMEAQSHRVLILVEEATARLTAQQRAERVAEIALKFRSSLTAIRTFTQLFAEKYDDPQFMHSFGKSMGNQVEELVALSKELGSIHESNCLSF